MTNPVFSSVTPMTEVSRAAAVKAARPTPKAPTKAVPAQRTTSTPAVPMLTDPRLPGVEITLELITPELAEHYLTKLPKKTADIQQRNLSPKTRDQYALDMADENWLFAGDPIRFNVMGELIDGQHRLRAIDQSNSSEMMIVIRGLEKETFSVFDTGRARSFPDVLKSMGIMNVSATANLTRRLLYWQRGNYGVANVARVLNPGFLGVRASTSVLLETFDKMRQPICHGAGRSTMLKHVSQPKTAAPGVVGFVYMLLSHLDLHRTESFFHELQFGPSVGGPEYPIAVLRDRLRDRVPTGQSGLPDWVWLHFFFTTWNAKFQEKSMKALRTPPGSTPTHLAMPIDPHAADRAPGWTPLGGVA